MVEIDSIEAFEKVIESDIPIGIIFTSNDCSACKALSAKLKNEENFFEVNIEKLSQIVSVAEVYSAPTIVIYMKSKQLNKFSGVFSLQEIFRYIERLKEYVCT